MPADWNPARRVLFITSVAVGGEWLTSFLPLPLNVALCQYKNLPLIQIADTTGIWGVSFLLWWANAALAEYAAAPPVRAGLGSAWRWSCCRCSMAACGLFATQPARDGIAVAAIQDLTREETGDLAAPGAEADRAAMTRQAVQQGAKLVVWSEESLGGEFAPDSPKDETRQLARSLSTALVVGYSDDTKPKPFNCAAYLAPDGRRPPARPPQNPPVPGRARDQLLRRTRPPSFRRRRGGSAWKSASIAATRTRRARRSGRARRLIAMPNYDPPTPRGVLHHLHGAMLPFRAVENRVPFVRADSNGLSQIVDANGRIVAQSPLFMPDVLVGGVDLGSGRGTFFTRWGDWLAYGCLLVVAGGLVKGWRVRRRPNEPPPPDQCLRRQAETRAVRRRLWLSRTPAPMP